jgi:nicotinic acid mononucleotide adenylyltransferase
MEDKKKDTKSEKKKQEVLVKNNIELNPKLDEATNSDTVVISWGRMNPPTAGHEKLVAKVLSVAKQNNAMPHIYLSQSYDSKKNPLPYKTKIRLARRAFGNLVTESSAKTIMQVAKELEDMGHKKLILVVGSDRVKEFETLLNKYNGKDYSFESIEIVSAGQRDPDAEGVEGMSASKMREAVRSGDESAFKLGLPKKLQSSAKSVFKAVRDGMQIAEAMEVELGEEFLSEVPLTLVQRRKRAISFRKSKSKILRGRKIAQRKMASTEKLEKRSRKKAIQIIRAKVAGQKGADYNSLTPAEKIQIDKKVEQRKGAITKIAKRLMPKVKKAERERLKSFMATKNEKVDNDILNTIMEAYFKVDIEGLPPVFINGPSGSSIKTELRKIIKKADENVASIERVQRSDIIKAFRLQSQGKSIDGDPIGVEESVVEDVNKEFESFYEDKQPYTNYKKFHELLKKDNTVKHDKRFRFNKKVAISEVEMNEAFAIATKSAKSKTGWRRVPDTKFLTKEKAENYGNKYHTTRDGSKMYKVVDFKEEVEMNESELFEHIDVMLESIRESEKIHDNLQEKADKSGIEFDAIFEKFLEEDTVEEAYQRLNSFIANEGKTPGLWDNIHKKRKRIKAGSNERMRSPGDKGAPTNAAFKAANEEASSWKTDGHYLKNGKEWDGDQHAYEGEVYTGKEHGPDSERLYHYKELSPNIRNAIDDSLKEYGAGEKGTDKLVKKYKKDTPGEC